MEKGDCIALEYEGRSYVLILHHIITENSKTEYGFIIVGESFENTPSKLEVEMSGVLGDKYQNDTVDLMNSAMRTRQKYDNSVFYTRVAYDVILIPKPLFDKEKQRINVIAKVNFNPSFLPMPNFYSRQNEYEGICKLIKNRILKKAPETVSWGRIYDSYPFIDILDGT